MPIKEILDEPVEKHMRRRCMAPESGLSVAEAACVMREKGVKSVVVAEEGKPIGILTMRDIFYKVVAEGKDPKETRLKEIASRPLITAEPGMKLREAMALMVRNDMRRLPLVEDGELIGVLIMRAVVGDMVERTTPIADVEPPEGFRCHYCGLVFATREELSKHIDHVHIGAGILEGMARW